MDPKKRMQLETKGIRITDSPAEIFGISKQRMALIDLRIELGEHVRELREKKGISQDGLAKMMDTKQPAIHRLERGAPNVSIEKYLMALQILGDRVSLKIGKKLVPIGKNAA